MSATEYDDISNKAIAAHLSRQDAALRDLDVQMRALMVLLQDSVTDRRALHRQIDDINTERARIMREAVVLRQGIEDRLTAVEGRGDLADIRTALTELVSANTLQLALHRWLTTHRVRARIVGLCTLAAIPVASQLVGILFRHLGWT
jgi:hypothetical protein